MVRIVIPCHEHFDLPCPEDVLQRESVFESDVCLSERETVFDVDGSRVKDVVGPIAHAVTRIDANLDHGFLLKRG
jgi:hypothetical protein